MGLQLKLVGGELDKAEVIRLPDTGDKDKDVQLWVLAPGAAGTVDVKLTGAMIRQQWAEKKANKPKMVAPATIKEPLNTDGKFFDSSQ